MTVPSEAQLSRPAGFSRNRVAAWLCRWEPLVLLALMGVLVFVTPGRSPWLIVLPLLWVCRFAAYRHFVPATPLDWPILLLMVTLLLNLFVTPNILQSLPKIANLLFGICLYYGLVAWATTERRRRGLLLGLAATGGVLVFIVLMVRWTLGLKMPALAPTHEVLSQIPRPLTLPGAEAGVNANEIGGVLVMFVPMSAMLVLAEGAAPSRSWLRIAFYLLVFAGTLAVTLASQSRAAMLGLLVGLLSLPAWRHWWGRIALIAALGILLALAVTGQLEPLLVSSGLLVPASEFDTLNGRLLVWKRALYFLAQAPLTGIGLNQFRLAMPAFWPMSSPLVPSDPGHAHNQFLHVAVEMGLPGLAAYAGIWAALFYRVIAALRQPANLPALRVALGCASGLLAFFTYGIFDAVALGARAGFPFWLFLAVAVVFTSPPAVEANSGPV